MSFTILLLSPDADPSWPEKIRQAVPGAVAKICADPRDALGDIETADAAYGTVPPELFARAKKLRWICASRTPSPSVSPMRPGSPPPSYLRYCHAVLIPSIIASRLYTTRGASL